METLTYLHAHVFNSTNAANLLAEKGGTHFEFAMKLLASKNKAVPDQLVKLNASIELKQSYLEKLNSGYAELKDSSYFTVAKELLSPHSLDLYRPRCPSTFDSKIRRVLQDIEQLRVDRIDLSVKIEKYQAHSIALASQNNPDLSTPAVADSGLVASTPGSGCSMPLHQREPSEN